MQPPERGRVARPQVELAVQPWRLAQADLKQAWAKSARKLEPQPTAMAREVSRRLFALKTRELMPVEVARVRLARRSE